MKRISQKYKIFIIILIMLCSLFLYCEWDDETNKTKEHPLIKGTIINHNCIDIYKIPVSAIARAKDTLHIVYGHTSHGSQLIKGMDTTRLDAFMQTKGYGVNTFAVAFDGQPEAYELDFLHNPWFDILDWEQYGRDLGTRTNDDNQTFDDQDYDAWVYTTRKYLGWDCDPGDGSDLSHYAQGTPAYNPAACNNCNVVMWAWCGQVAYNTIDIEEDYLKKMSRLEQDYPEVTFVYMTGHVDGTPLTSYLHTNNQIIRDYCEQNNKFLYDFADIESWDPDGNYYGDKLASASCNYDADGDGELEEISEYDPNNPEHYAIPTNGDENWAVNWQDDNPSEWYESFLNNAHTTHLNHNLKAYACWWLFAYIAGWSGPVE